jgi:hypothetical protein
MMTIIDSMLVTMTRRVPTRESDGEGGHVTTWADGDTFPGVLSKFATGHKREGEHDIPIMTATLTTPGRVEPLNTLDVFRDDRGYTWRVMGPHHEFPPASILDYNRYVVERWEEAS